MPIFLAQLELASPSRLLLLALLPAIVWLALVGRKDQPLRQRLTSAALRSLVVALLAFAWAVPSWRATSQRRFVIFVRDESHSCIVPLRPGEPGARLQGGKFVSDALAHQGTNVARQLKFAEYPQLSVAYFDDFIDCRKGMPTDIAAAIAAAQAACPNDYVPQLVLLSDGLETQGNTVAAAMSANIPIDVVPLTPFPEPEISIDRLEAPMGAAARESFDIVATFITDRPIPAMVSLYRNDEMLAEQPLDLTQGETKWRYATHIDDASAATFTVYIDPVEAADDPFDLNNSLTALVLASTPAKVLVVDSEPRIATPLAATLSKLGYEAQALLPNELPTVDAQLQSISLILLRDVAPSSLGPQRQAALDRFVRAGGGLLVVGGEKSFGAANYQLTGLEKMLPVVATEQPEEQQRSLALVLVVDKSLSMKDDNRLELAKQASKSAVELLGERDQVGVVAFGDESQWVSRLAPLADKNEVLARIDKLEASGLTNMYPAIARAYLALSQADADRRYAIILTDGVPSPGDFGEIARKMADAGITVSTVSLSAGADQTILKDIARIARGNHHHADDPADLPQILAGETRTAVSQVAPHETSAAAARNFPGLSVASAPPLSGFVTTRFKPGAQVLLTAGDGDPLVAWWRYGRGVAMVATADLLGEANGPRWRDWSGSAAFWQTLTRHALRDEPPSPMQLDFHEENGKLIVTFDALFVTDEGVGFVNDAVASLSIESATDGKMLETKVMQQIAPGRYEATLDPAPRRPVIFSATYAYGGMSQPVVRRGYAPRYAEEFRLRPTDEAKLKLIAGVTGGKFNPSPASVFAPDGRTVDVLYPLAAYFLIAALVVYLGDVAVRRIPWNRRVRGGSQRKEEKRTIDHTGVSSLRSSAPSAVN